MIRLCKSEYNAIYILELTGKTTLCSICLSDAGRLGVQAFKQQRKIHDLGKFIVNLNGKSWSDLDYLL